MLSQLLIFILLFKETCLDLWACLFDRKHLDIVSNNLDIVSVCEFEFQFELFTNLHVL